MKCPEDEEKKFPHEVLSEALDGLPVSRCCRVQKVDKVRASWTYLLDRPPTKLDGKFPRRQD